MTDFVNVATWFFDKIWNFLTHVTVPGLGGITFGTLFFGLFLIEIAFILIRNYIWKKGEN